MNRAAHRSLAVYVLAAFVGVWVYAALLPCVQAAAMPRCDSCPPRATVEIDKCPPTVQTDCTLPDLKPISVDLLADVKIAPRVIALLPVTIDAAPEVVSRRHAENAVRNAPPPLALRPATLLL